jgi:hypothetical protein
MSGGVVIGKHGQWYIFDPANLSKNECSGTGASSGESHTKAEDRYGQFIGSSKVGISGAVTNGKLLTGSGVEGEYHSQCD